MGCALTLWPSKMGMESRAEAAALLGDWCYYFPKRQCGGCFPSPEVEGVNLAVRRGNTEEPGEPGCKEPAADTHTVSVGGSPQLRTKAVLQDQPQVALVGGLEHRDGI